MRYPIRGLPTETGALDGLSERLIASHYIDQYGRAVRRLNAIEAELEAADFATLPAYRLNGLKREALLAHNSMVLHELYFDCLGAGPREPEGDLAGAIEQSFGSFALWRLEFTAMGRALAGGSGWVLLTRSGRDGRLVNQWAADHAHALAGGRPVLALDLYEHAYQVDFGGQVAEYVEAFMGNVDWGRVAEHFHGERIWDVAKGSDAVAPEAAIRTHAGTNPPTMIDVRPAASFAASPLLIPGAVWRDPEKIGIWARETAIDREVVVYCAYGHRTSRDAAAALREAGRLARHLTGGLAAWQALGGPTVAKSVSA